MQPLASGRHGTVWRATGGAHAVQVLPKSRGDMRPGDNARMMRAEIEALQRMRGARHVIQLDAVREDADAFHLEMELGQPLSDGCFLPRLIAHDVAMGLHECHERGVLHGDVKPSNVVYSPIARVFKLVDFGSSMHGSGGYHLRWSTLQFMAPEVLRDNGAYSPHADVWSLGMLMQDVSRRCSRADPRIADAAHRCLHPTPAMRPAPLEVARMLKNDSAPPG